MRRLLYSLTFTFVLLLVGSASLASPNVPGGGGTVPAYQVWLPVVEMASCPYKVGQMWYTPRPSGSYPYPEAHYFGFNMPDVDIAEINLTGRMNVALDADMKNIIYNLKMEQFFWSLSAKLEQNELNIGQVYYWQAQVVCENGVPGPQSAIQEFIAARWE